MASADYDDTEPASMIDNEESMIDKDDSATPSEVNELTPSDLPENGMPSNGHASEDSSASTSGTSGFIEKSPEASDESGKPEVETSGQSQIKILTDFETFLPENMAVENLRSALKKRPQEATTERRSVRFDVVREFRFARTESFVTMPSSGGCSLGMGEFILSINIYLNT